MTEHEYDLKAAHLERLVYDLERAFLHQRATYVRIRRELPLLFLTLFTAGFAAGVALTRIVQG